MKVICSGRNFFPKGAWFYSTKEQSSLAKGVGYVGLNFLPTWRFVWEILTLGRLSSSPSMILSAHRDWRYDRIMEAKVRNKPWWLYQIRNKEDWLFPPLSWCLTAMKRFQTLYKKPVSVMWLEDAANFFPVVLELWDKIQGVNQRQLITWCKKDRRNHGVVIDTLKFSGWLKSNGLENKKNQVIDELMPYIKWVDYRATKKNREPSLAVTIEKMVESERLFKLLLKKGYRGDVVVEYGWPDLESPPFGIIRENRDAFNKFHKNLIKKITNKTL